MIGAIIGDIVGSRFEWDNHRSKDFELFTRKCFATDDSIMTLAIAKALLESKPDHSDLGAQAVRCMQEVGRPYPGCGYGGSFYHWMYSDDPQPYNSFGNGAAMRVSPCGFAARSLEEAKQLSRAVTEVTHNHPEGIKGAEATTVAIYMARTGSTLEEIREVIDREYYPLNFTLDGIRDTYRFNETCQETVPQALLAFFESTSFEDAIRNAISIGGDSDTLAAITGGVAEAYYGVPEEIRTQALGYKDEQKAEALKLLGRVGLKKASETLGIHSTTLQRWRHVALLDDFKRLDAELPEEATSAAEQPAEDAELPEDPCNLTEEESVPTETAESTDEEEADEAALIISALTLQNEKLRRRCEKLRQTLITLLSREGD